MLSSLIYNAFLSCRGNGVINEAGCWDYLVGMTSAAIHVAQVPESGWPCPLPPAAPSVPPHEGYRRGTPLPAQALPAMRVVLLQSAIQNRESKIVCRPFGDPDWVTDTAKRLGLECTVRPRGRPKKQS